MGSLRGTRNPSRTNIDNHVYGGYAMSRPMTRRQAFRVDSNNPRNPDQNICGQRVCAILGVSQNVRYIHTQNDITRAIRTRFSVRSVKSAAKAATVGAARANVSKIDRAVCFVCFVKGHVLLLDHNGKTIVDTAPRKRDRRKILAIYGVYNK